MDRGYLRLPDDAVQWVLPLINGSDTNFSQPFVLTYPQSGYPTDVPRPQLLVGKITGLSRGRP